MHFEGWSIRVEAFLLFPLTRPATLEQACVAKEKSDMTEPDKRERKKFAVQLSTGRRDVGKVKSALMFAALAQYSGCDAVVYCVQDGADAVIKGAIKEEEKKLQALKGEIVAKIDTLKGLEDKLSGMLDTVKSAEDKRLKDLATVFEATAPAQAGPMLEKMDKKLAAGIIMNMKSKKAGAIWGHISAQRAAEIAKEITATPGGKPEAAN